MAAKRGELVPRPPRKIEYEIRYPTTEAAKGWQDLAATTIRNPLAEAWDFLTRTPLTKTPTNYPLRGELATISRGDKNLRALAAQAPLASSADCRAVVRTGT